MHKKNQYKHMRVLHQKIHHHLKLRHHKHTGKVLHHKHTSYRGLAVVLVLSAVVMGGATLAGRAAADSLFAVEGTAPTAVPTMPATISTPVDNSTLKNSSVLVTGSCPMITPQVVVAVLLDGTPAGTSACSPANDFSVPVTFGSGAHTLQTKTYTVASQPGPDGAVLHITSTAAPTPRTPLAFTTIAPFSYLGADKTAVWTTTITGGSAPYFVHIDWSDGTQDNETVVGGVQHFRHIYSSLQSYNPLISMTDNAGNTISTQFAVAAYTVAELQSATAGAPAPSGGAVPSSTLVGLYGLFLTTSSVCGIIWLEAAHAARHQIGV